MPIFDAQFSTGQVTEATGVTNAALQSWLRRELIIGHRDSPIGGGGSPGVHRRFSFFNVMEIAVAKALIDSGYNDVPSAFAAARLFAHTGDAPIGDLPARLPAMPFDNRDMNCHTLLCVGPNGADMTIWAPGRDVWANMRRLGEGFFILHIDPIFERVVMALKHNYHHVTDAAYPPKAN